MKVFVTYDSKKYSISFNPENCTVKQFKENVFSLTGVPPQSQKLFGCPGFSSRNASSLLSKFRIKDGSHFLLRRQKGKESKSESTKPSQPSSSDVDPSFSIDDLPAEVQYLIFSAMDEETLLSCAKVNSNWNANATDDWMWHNLYLERFPGFEEPKLMDPNLNWRLQYFDCKQSKMNWLLSNFQTTSINRSAISCMDFSASGYLSTLDVDEKAKMDKLSKQPSDILFGKAGINRLFSNYYNKQRADSMIVFGEHNTITVSNPFRKDAKQKTLLGHTHPVTTTTFAGSHHIVSSDESGIVCLWDLHKPASLLPWSNVSSELVSRKQWNSIPSVLSVDDLSSTLVTGSSDGTIVLVDLDRSVYPARTLYSAHKDRITSICFPKSSFSDLKSRNVFASSSEDGFVKIFDTRSASPVTQIWADPEGVKQVSMGHANQLITSGLNGTRIWDMRIPTVIMRVNHESTYSHFYDGSTLLLGTAADVKIADLGYSGIPISDDEDISMTNKGYGSSMSSSIGHIDNGNKIPGDDEPFSWNFVKIVTQASKLFADHSFLVAHSNGNIIALDMNQPPPRRRQRDFIEEMEDAMQDAPEI